MTTRLSPLPSRPRGVSRALSLALMIGGLLAACGGGSGTAAPTPAGATSKATAATTPKATTGATTSGPVITDLCGLVGAAAVSAALGQPVTAGTTNTASGSTTCTFSGTSGPTVAIAVTPGFSSLSGWDFQMKSLGMKAANAVPGIGEAAYARAGLPFGDPGASFSAYQDHTGVDVTIKSTADPNALLAAAIAIGKLLADAIF